MIKKIMATALVSILIIVASTTVVIVSAFNKEKINIILYGIDGRENDEFERSDSIIAININYKSQEIVATSIPRDSYVQITCKNNQYDKINHAYAYGKKECLKSTVKQLLSINKLNYAIIDFDNIIELINYFGLVELIPNNTFCQSDINFERKYCFEKGKKSMINGEQALAYMRNRKSLPNGDIDRVENQRQILKIIIQKIMKLSLMEKIKYFNFMKKHVETDITLKDINIKKLINVNKITVREYTLKGEDYINKYYYYKLDMNYLEKIKKYYV